jgi:uncharacterized Zn-binding protein involved in type VI secretion
VGVTVIVNKLTVVHQGSGGIATAAAPDVCLTPGPPSGPVPMPYPNIAKSSDLAAGTTTVQADGQPIAIKDSMFSQSTGDEAGVAGGVVSGVIKGIAKFVNYSMDVKIEGGNAARLGDPMTMNGNGPNSATPAVVQPNLVAMVGPDVADLLCRAFCFCNRPGMGGSDAGGGITRAPVTEA